MFVFQSVFSKVYFSKLYPVYASFIKHTLLDKLSGVLNEFLKQHFNNNFVPNQMFHISWSITELSALLLISCHKLPWSIPAKERRPWLYNIYDNDNNSYDINIIKIILSSLNDINSYDKDGNSETIDKYDINTNQTKLVRAAKER